MMVVLNEEMKDYKLPLMRNGLSGILLKIL